MTTYIHAFCMKVQSVYNKHGKNLPLISSDFYWFFVAACMSEKAKMELKYVQTIIGTHTLKI